MIDFEARLRQDHRGEVIIGVVGWYGLDETERSVQLRKVLYGAIVKHFGFDPIRWISRFSISREITEPNLDLYFRWKFLAVPVGTPLFAEDDWISWALQIEDNDSEGPTIFRERYV